MRARAVWMGRLDRRHSSEQWRSGGGTGGGGSGGTATTSAYAGTHAVGASAGAAHEWAVVTRLHQGYDEVLTHTRSTRAFQLKYERQ